MPPRSVPPLPPLAVGLGRLGTPDSEMIAIACAEHGYRLRSWVDSIDKGAAMVERNDADVLVVPQIPREPRELREQYRAAIERVEAAGGLVESATDALDASTTAGRIRRGEIAEHGRLSGQHETHVRRTTWPGRRR